MPASAAALLVLLAWCLFAFGAVYDWAFAPAATLAVAGGLVVAIGRRAPWTWLDRWLLLTVAAALFQLIPLPEGVRAVLSPAQAAYVSRTSLAAPQAGQWLPLSLYPGARLMGAVAGIAAIATFIWTRDGLDSRGVRRVARGIGWMGLVAAIVAVVQPALFPPGRIYGFWIPESVGAHPVGPLVSRNHFAAWIVLAFPMTVGYLVSHGRTHWLHRRTKSSVLALSDARAIWLALAAALMIAGLLVTQSRAGAIGFCAAVSVLVWLVWKRTGGAGRTAMVGLIVVSGLAALLWASPDPLVGRFERAWSGVDGSRPLIWAQTWRLALDFPIAGIGLGAFEVVMPAYQTSFGSLLNHAHNQYLHVLAEGGLLVSVPLTLAVAAFAGLARRRLRGDQTPLSHVRAGALAGLVGLAVLSIFEVPLLTPAVLLLAAVAAGVVVRDTGGDAGEAQA